MRRPSRWRHAVAGLSLAASLAGIAVFSALYRQSELEVAKQKASSGLLAKQDSRPHEATPGQAKPQESKTLPETTGQQAIPRTGIVLNQPAVDKAESTQDKIAISNEPGSKPTNPASPVSVGAVATAMNRHLNEYWTRIGIEPTKTASDSEIATRIEARIGYKPNVINGSIDQELFASREQAEPIAARLVSTLTDRLPVSGESKQQMIGEAAQTIATGGAFDGLIANWVREGRFAAGAQPQVVGEIVAEHLLDADLACARCHDSPVDSSLTQKDYWSFAACFKPTTQPNLFYELPDGRQRAADAAIPMRWTGLSESGSPANRALEPSVTGIAHLLQNNPRLAESLANRVWETVYGAPLVSKSSDPLAPPRDDALQQMHARLATAIQDAGFDLRPAYRIALNSDSMKRTTPDLFKGDGWVTASEDQLAKEGVRIRTFAAQAPAMVQLPRQQLLSAMSTKLGHDPMALKNLDTLLAQPLLGIENRNGNSEVSSVPRSAMSEQEKVWTLWLTDRKAVEDSWLHWIKDPPSSDSMHSMLPHCNLILTRNNLPNSYKQTKKQVNQPPPMTG